MYPLQALCQIPSSASHWSLPEDRSRPLPPLPPAFQSAANMAHARVHGVATMPSTQDRLAPFFSSKIDYLVEEFIQEFEEIADGHRLTNQQKVETIIRYIDTSQHHIWKSLQGYLNRNWHNFCNELRNEYVNPTTQGQFSKQRLVNYTDKSAQVPMKDEADVIDYHCNFNSLSKLLLDEGRITTGKHNTIFWRGFHPNNRQELYERLIAKKLDQPKGQAFDLQDVLHIARQIFSGDNDFLLQELPP